MKSPTLLAGCALACVALSGCAGFTVPGMTGGGTAANNAMSNFLTDPNCAHHDEATLVTGAAGMPASFQAKVSRDCPVKTQVGPTSAEIQAMIDGAVSKAAAGIAAANAAVTPAKP